jgi:hypothetical protein
MKNVPSQAYFRNYSQVSPISARVPPSPVIVGAEVLHADLLR